MGRSELSSTALNCSQMPDNRAAVTCGGGTGESAGRSRIILSRCDCSIVPATVLTCELSGTSSPILKTGCTSAGTWLKEQRSGGKLAGRFDIQP